MNINLLNKEESPADKFVREYNERLAKTSEQQDQELEQLEFGEPVQSAMQPSSAFEDVDLFLDGGAYEQQKEIALEQLSEMKRNMSPQQFEREYMQFPPLTETPKEMYYRLLDDKENTLELENEMGIEITALDEPSFVQNAMNDSERRFLESAADSAFGGEPNYEIMPQGMKELQQRNDVRGYKLITGDFEYTDDTKTVVYFREHPKGVVALQNPNFIDVNIISLMERRFPNCSYMGRADYVLWKPEKKEADLFTMSSKGVEIDMSKKSPFVDEEGNPTSIGVLLKSEQPKAIFKDGELKLPIDNPMAQSMLSKALAQSEPSNELIGKVTAPKGKQKVPRDFDMGTKTKAEFFGQFRSAIRKIWMFSAIRKEAVKLAKKAPNRYMCAHCKALFKSTEIEVNHKHSAGSLREFTDFTPFMTAMFQEDLSKLEVLCKECHKKHTNLSNVPIVHIVQKVTYKEEPHLFDDITEFSIDSIQDHRRGSNFFRHDIIEFKSEHAKWFTEIVDFEKYLGVWKTNTVIWDAEQGWDETFSELERVTPTETKTITYK